MTGQLTRLPVVYMPAMPREQSAIRDVAHERLPFVQFFRAAAIVLVVLCHCGDLFPTADVAHTPVFEVLTRHVNILFTLMSGFLFQILISRYSYREYLIKKTRNVIVPYLLTSLPAMTAYLVGLKPIQNLGAPESITQPLELTVFMIVTGAALAPLWFIPMIAILFLLAPLWKLIDRHPHAYWIILLWLPVSLALGRSGSDVNPLQNAIYYAPIYLAGMAMGRFRHDVLPVLSRYWPVLLLALLLPIAIDVWRPLNDAVMLISKVVLAMGLIGLLLQYSDKLPRQLGILGEMSFGIYFIHYYLVAGAAMLIAAGLLPAPHGVFMLAASVILVTGISALSVAGIARMSGRMSRLVIGF